MSDAAGLADLIDASEAPAQASISLVDADIIDASVTADAAPAKVQDSSAEQPMKEQEAEDNSEKQVATKAADVNEAPANDSSGHACETADNHQPEALQTVSSSGSKLTAAEEPAAGAPALHSVADKGSAEDRSSTGGAARTAAAAASLVDLADSNGTTVDNAVSDPEVVKPQRSVSELRKQLTSGGGSSPSAADATTAAATPAAPSPGPGGERSASPVLSPHDKVNTTNVAALLQASEFKLRPGVDEVPYEQLVGLRLEDGIDVTRKEEYLSAEDFKVVMGLDRDAYSKLPQWKKLQIKRQVNLF